MLGYLKQSFIAESIFGACFSVCFVCLFLLLSGLSYALVYDVKLLT